MKIITGLFQTDPDVRHAVSALDQNRFISRGVVNIIDQSRVSPKDAISDAEDNRLYRSLTRLGVSPEKARSYAEQLKRGSTLIVVETEEGRAAQVVDIMRHANAREWASEDREPASPSRPVG